MKYKKIYSCILLSLSLSIMMGCNNTNNINNKKEDNTKITKQELKLKEDKETASNEENKNNKEIDAKTVIIEGNKLVNNILTSAKEEYKTVNDTKYYILPTEYNSDEKITKALDKYWSSEIISQERSYIPAKQIDDKYVLPCGQLGDIPDWDSFEIKNQTKVDDNTIEVYGIFTQKYSEDYKCTLKFENGLWKITKYQYIDLEKLSD